MYQMMRQIAQTVNPAKSEYLIRYNASLSINNNMRLAAVGLSFLLGNVKKAHAGNVPFKQPNQRKRNIFLEKFSKVDRIRVIN
jgi:hypothetical protein